MDPNLVLACRILLKPDAPMTHPFFLNLQLPQVKQAYRRKALACHPDRVPISDEVTRKRFTEAFIRTSWAYQEIDAFLKKRDQLIRSMAEEKKKSKTGRVEGPTQDTEQNLRYYRGKLPRRRLLFGEFLYYSGRVPWKTLIEAVVWQRKQRPRFGDIAKRWYHLSPEDIHSLMLHRRPQERIGEAAIRHALLNRFQVSTIIHFQRSRQRKIGEYFMERGFIHPRHLKGLLSDFQRYNGQFGFSRRPLF